ncbi:hypothetical protein [Draconibacterium sediminis]|uniref:ATP-grasp domain-containing protein n=1 Tax=Draconibacterium sediminis TaxID=1544798 RepID=A0A0D8J617_9BACT|nr:hypothetical protein [Draconibacterium sediminis]KJF42410.1 hypothetical protein LH29_17715 [Draconibacterium sediminis]
MQKSVHPSIYLFNPTCEYAVANGNASWHPNKILQKMEADLATLPLYFAAETDVVIVPQIPTTDFFEHLQKIGVTPPVFATEKELKNNPPEQVGKLQPWGWSPAVHKRLESFKPLCSSEFKSSPVFMWKAEYRELYSKKFALQILRQLTDKHPSASFIGENEVTEICETQDQIETLLAKWDKLMVKAPWSSSGRGLQPITRQPIHEKVWEKLLGIVKEQGYAIVEAFQNKELDLAFQFELKAGEIQYLGTSNFSADKKGQYLGNSLNGLPDELDEEVKDFAREMSTLIVPALKDEIGKSKLAENYEGYFGVDTLIFRDKTGALKINPCLEINVRHNMGLLSLYLEKFIAPTKKGRFRMFFNPKTPFADFCRQMSHDHPLVLENQKIVSGFFTLTAITYSTGFGAYLLV